MPTTTHTPGTMVEERDALLEQNKRLVERMDVIAERASAILGLDLRCEGVTEKGNRRFSWGLPCNKRTEAKQCGPCAANSLVRAIITRCRTRASSRQTPS